MREFLNRVTQVNTKERWLNDHHRAIISGKDYDPITTHHTNKELTLKITEKHLDPTLLRAAGVQSLPEYAPPTPESKIRALPGYGSTYSPPKPYDYEEYKAPTYAQPVVDYSKKGYYDSEIKSKSFGTPPKESPSAYPKYYAQEEISSQHSYRGSKHSSKHESVHDSIHGTPRGSQHSSAYPIQKASEQPTSRQSQQSALSSKRDRYY